MKYKVGDKVRVRKDLDVGKRYYMDDKKECNSVVSEMMKFAGKIVEIAKADGQYEIRGSIWLWTDEMFEPVNDKKIVITSDGVETLARLYDGNKVIKTATAKCSPDDTFDFETGARIAFDRLIESPITKALKNLANVAKKCGEALRNTTAAVEVDNENQEWRVVNRPVKDGDYIRLTSSSFSFDKVGDVLMVDRVTSAKNVEVRGDNPTRKRPTTQKSEYWLYLQGEFEVVEPVEKKEKTHEYKKGDKVKVIACTCSHGMEIGKVVTLDRTLAADGGRTRWLTKEYKETWYIRECDFEPYVEPKKKPFKFEVGKQYQNGDLVIEITGVNVTVRRYEYKVIKGNDGPLKSFDENSFFGKMLKPYDPPKYYNGKVVCVEKTYPWAAYTVGKVYEFKDGRVKIDNEKTFPTEDFKPVKSLDEFNNNHAHYGKFIPFVE